MSSKVPRPAAFISSAERGSGIGELIPGWAGVCAEVHKSRVQLWRDIRAGLFPAPIETGPNSVAWLRAEIEEWKRTRPRRTYRAEQNLAAELDGKDRRRTPPDTRAAVGHHFSASPVRPVRSGS
jgi:predicted DNA-binding transcriptional regulator AlpA